MVSGASGRASARSARRFDASADGGTGSGEISEVSGDFQKRSAAVYRHPEKPHFPRFHFPTPGGGAGGSSPPGFRR